MKKGACKKNKEEKVKKFKDQMKGTKAILLEELKLREVELLSHLKTCPVCNSLIIKCPYCNYPQPIRTICAHCNKAIPLKSILYRFSEEIVEKGKITLKKKEKDSQNPNHSWRRMEPA